MNLWFFVLLLVTMALVLGPIAMLRPTPAQKRTEALRKHALEMGVKITMRRLPARKTDMEARPLCPIYFLPPSTPIQFVDDWILMRTDYEHEGNFYREWDWLDSARPVWGDTEQLRNILEVLPASVLAIAQGKSGTCVFWSEAGGDATLETIVRILQQLDAAVRQ